MGDADGGKGENGSEQQREDVEVSEEEKELRDKLERLEKKMDKPIDLMVYSMIVTFVLMILAMASNSSIIAAFMCFSLIFMIAPLVYGALHIPVLQRTRRRVFLLNYGETVFEDSLTG